jgi:hypothetical protein
MKRQIAMVLGKNALLGQGLLLNLLLKTGLSGISFPLNDK